MRSGGLIPNTRLADLTREADELTAITVASIKTARANAKADQATRAAKAGKG